MNYIKSLLISILLCLTQTGQAQEQIETNDCDSLRVSYNLKKVNESISALDILIDGGNGQVKIILTKEAGSLISKDFTEQHFDSLKPGTYYCTIIDGKLCKKHLEIIIP